MRQLERIGDGLITEHVRPVHDQAVEELARLAPKLDGIASDE